MKRILKNSARITYFLVLAVFLASCGNNKAEEQEQTKAGTEKEEETSVAITAAQYKTAGIILGSPEMKALSGTLKVNGLIDVPPQNLVSITTQMGGIVKSTPLLPGSTVKKGQVIAVLQNQEYVQLQQDYLESKSQLELTDSEYKRQQTLAAQNVNSQKTVQQARAQYQITLAKENALKQRLQLININPASLTPATIRSQVNIYAPISGYVTKVNVNTGKFVNPNDVMFEIVNSSNLHVELNVFEKDAAKVKPGQRVRFTLSNDSTEQIAIVQLVGGEINPDKTVTVHTLAKNSKGFIPGTYLKAFIETGSTKVLTLPQSAVVDFGSKKYIFIATADHASADHAAGSVQPQGSQDAGVNAGSKEYHFEMTAVTTGISDGGYIEVNIAGERDLTGKVVLQGAYDLLSKMKNSEEE